MAKANPSNRLEAATECGIMDYKPNAALRWSYEEAFSRNRGIISRIEQEKLRTKCVAIAGMGGIGGIDLVTLARLGVGRFTIADPDTFEPANTNRQFGAMVSTMGRNKAEVMAEIVRDINPEADVRVFAKALDDDNIPEFMQGADLFVDAIEVFEMDVRRRLFEQAARQGLYAITAGPVGFSGIWIVFDPVGMSFDRYFDLSDGMSPLEKLVAFAVGVAPKATQRPYMDLRDLDIAGRRGPSSAAACHLAAGAMACESLKLLLGRGRVRTAPHYQQFDAYRGLYARGYLWRGNRHPWQRIKRAILAKTLKRQMKADANHD